MLRPVQAGGAPMFGSLRRARVPGNSHLTGTHLYQSACDTPKNPTRRTLLDQN